MTKLITAVIIIAMGYCAYHLFLYWESVKEQEENQQKQAASVALQGDSLPGMPSQLYESLRGAQQRGNPAMREWLKTYGPLVQDPRKAWLELDFCVAIAREDPAEARRIFKSVKDRTPPSSPVWPRINQLEKSYE
jgi:hypothetical protein